MTHVKISSTGLISDPRDCRNSADVAIVIDSSGSVPKTDFNKSLQFTQNLINILDINSGKIRLGVVTFSTTPATRIKLNQFSNTQDLSEEIGKIPYEPGTTDTAAMFRFLRDSYFTAQNGDRNDIVNVVVVITDGDSNDHDATIGGAVYARAGGITVITVGPGSASWIDPHQLNSMSSYPHTRNSLRAADYASLVSLSPLLAGAICDGGCN